MSGPRIIEIRKKILGKNDQMAQELRAEFGRNKLYVANLVSGPGAGKTELLSRTLTALGSDYRCAAVTGDLATENDAIRLAATGAPARQILTGTMCHLEIDMVRGAIEGWNLAELDFLFIENVGNLVCPGDFDLGEDVRVLLLSTTEGEDKPLKYPTLLASADVVVINKLDLAAAVECDVALLEHNVHQVRPGIPIFKLSAKTGAGCDPWLAFLRAQFTAKAG
ncbi:MAG: hydrogenase nickel incorporation protein HypB [Anaerolineae bacterium]|nr:hydrogenase nickel incorporation protein HypB [Anaerolineae bacterium]MCO5199109.1 hydrogenase nickel incorporation protein HypB [Anaerolineae bacterium]